MNDPSSERLYLLHLSLHGLLRAASPELGRDADTGGQIGYVLELCKTLGVHPGVARVDVLTRLIEDQTVGSEYAAALETLGPRARIVRLPFGPRRYLRKELLWPHLDVLVDRVVELLRAQERLPNLIHSHYADAGYVGVRLSRLLGIPLVHTGHSLGRTKKARLLSSGRLEAALERQFHFASRIAAEEEVLGDARLVIGSTRQEVDEQWRHYENFQASRLAVVAPGVDTSRFSPPAGRGRSVRCPWIDRFLERPELPLILALSRPAPKKNLPALVEAFAREGLREMANLAILAGSREDIATTEEGAREVYTELLLAIDRFDLWGSVALPKRHTPDDVPEVYRLAGSRRGIFVNPALVEPFGLTLLEAAASGLPVVATADGGPRDIVAACRNGLLVDPTNVEALASALREALSDPARWRRWSQNGLRNVRSTYSWTGHVDRYVELCRQILRRDRKTMRRRHAGLRAKEGLARLGQASHVLVTDIDDTLVGERDSLAGLLEWRKRMAPGVAFGVATGRTLPMALEMLKEWDVPVPDFLVTSVGTEIWLGPDLRPDRSWRRHIQHDWRRDTVAAALSGVPGITRQEERRQGPYKVSFDILPSRSLDLEGIRRLLRARGLKAQLIASQGRFLDVLPARASKGLAVRFLALRLGLGLESFLVAGDSGNDLEMLVGDTMAVVVGNHKPELESLRGRDRVFFATAPYAGGILEGIAHYRFAEETTTC